MKQQGRTMQNNPFPVSALFNEKNFYEQFIYDLRQSKNEVIIESPFISTARMKVLYPIFEKLIKHRIKIYFHQRPKRT